MKTIIKKIGAVLLACGSIFLFRAPLKAQSLESKDATQMKSTKEKK